MKWYKKDDLPTNLLNNYIESKTNRKLLSSCNTDKTSCFSCDMKCRTRGIQLGINNCGVIVGYRELFGSESSSQVALMYLDICDHYQSKN
jgi:hypothetical protein